MANTYFQFKQFRIEQELAAMKVCTDACLFGAWVAAAEKSNQRQRILDIGTGTGLLSLMLAQQVSGFITAIDIDAAAVEQATHNFQHSPWKERLQVVQADFRQWAAPPVDLIICNPPFFDGDLLSANPREQQAKHTVHLSFDALLNGIAQNLAADGCAYLLMAARYHEELSKHMLQAGLIICQQVWVKQSPRHEAFRVMFQLGKKSTGNRLNQTYCIRDNDHVYTPEFRALLKDYYLAF